MMWSKNKAVFFDKDGVLNEDNGIVDDMNNLKIFQDAADVIAYFRNMDFKIFVITNQTVVSRGIITEESLNQQFEELQLRLLEQNKEAVLDKICYCPHHPNADVPKYRQTCQCRKPKPGMLLLAAKEFDIDLKESFMVGDRISDIIAGYLAGCKTIQCGTDKYNEPMIETDLKIPEDIKPDFAVMGLSELKEIIS